MDFRSLSDKIRSFDGNFSLVQKYFNTLNLDFKLSSKDKSEWLQKLRSGKYIQGKSGLCKENKHCCLGVFIDGNFPISTEKEYYCIGFTSYKYKEYNVNGNYCDIFIPAELIPQEIQNFLAAMNDNDYTFEQIADFIEKNL